jgi:carboxyl-terminal processing protease
MRFRNGDCRRPRRLAVGLWACVLVLLLGSGCGQETPTASTTPTSSLASSYTGEILDIMQQNSLRRAEIDWTDFRTQVVERAQGAQTIGDLYPAISLALGLLGDHHSFYQAASGREWVSNPRPKACIAPPVEAPALPPDIGYVHISGFSSTVPGADRAFADEIQAQIESQDSRQIVGWIVDVRGNTGGNMWPMLAGVGSVLGDGVAGYFVPPGAASTPWGYRDGRVFSDGGEFVLTSKPYALIAPNPRVAVLTDKITVSSGEATVVSFRARPNTRSFGTATCGLSTANYGHVLSDGADLFLTQALMADRTGKTYGESIAPDETVYEDAEAVERAIAWLRQ